MSCTAALTPCAREQSQAAEQPLVCPRSLLRAGVGVTATSLQPCLEEAERERCVRHRYWDAFKVAVDLTDDTKQS